ncbi:MAG: Holliday junction resolvase-like protein [Dehalococcoidales bacterium]|nr:Holliday junction resolvase-like protein [Dehalococcoidales bacterium]
MPTPAIITIAAVATILGILLAYYIVKIIFEQRFRQWQQIAEQKWAEERTKAARDAVNQSRAVLGGKFTEQMAPFLPDFRYDPTEARFIGSPIDFIVFPGLAQGDPKEIVIMEIKSGKNAQLTNSERKIRQLIEEGMVRWELLQKSGPENASGAPKLPL